MNNSNRLPGPTTRSAFYQPPRAGSSNCPRPGSSICPRPGSSICARPGSSICPRPGGPNCLRPGSSNCPHQGSSNCPQPGSFNCPRPGSCNCPRPGCSNCPRAGSYDCPLPRNEFRACAPFRFSTNGSQPPVYPTPLCTPTESLQSMSTRPLYSSATRRPTTMPVSTLQPIPITRTAPIPRPPPITRQESSTFSQAGNYSAEPPIVHPHPPPSYAYAAATAAYPAAYHPPCYVHLQPIYIWHCCCDADPPPTTHTCGSDCNRWEPNENQQPRRRLPNRRGQRAPRALEFQSKHYFFPIKPSKMNEDHLRSELVPLIRPVPIRPRI